MSKFNFDKNKVGQVFGAGMLFASAVGAFIKVFADDKLVKDVEQLKAEVAELKEKKED